MAKRNRDLFEILGARTRGDGANGIVRRVQEIVSPQPATKTRRKKKDAQPAGAQGLLLAAVGFGCLVVGFAGGRWSAGSAPPEDLNTAVRTADAFGARPSRIGAAPAVPSDENLREKLSTHAHLLLPFPVPETPGGDRAAFEDAKRVAVWLRGEGFSNVGLRPLKLHGKNCWVVLNYVDSEADTADYEKLAALGSPEFAPGFGAYVAEHPKIYLLKH